MGAGGKTFDLGIFRADGQGNVRTTVTMPSGTPTGSALIEAIGFDPGGAPVVAKAPVEILALPPTDLGSGDGSRPDAATLTGVLATLLGLFVALLLVLPRRRKARMPKP